MKPSIIPALAALLVANSTPALATGTVQLSRDAVRHLENATLLGPVAPTQLITVGIVLSNPNQAAEDQYLASLNDPASPNYQQFLEPDEFQASFGVPAASFQAVAAWLGSAGLTVIPIDSATSYVMAQGTAAQIQGLFGTTLNNYVASTKLFYANTTAPSVPASLPIAKVFGLNDFNRFYPPQITAKDQPRWTTSPINASVPVTGLLRPRDLWTIYDLPPSNLGDGQAMAIFGWGVTTNVVSNLRTFEAENQLPGIPVTIKLYGSTSTPDTNDGATGEWDLDTQASSAMAPHATGITLYFGHHNSDADLLAAFTGWVNDRYGPRQGSASFGECENIPAAESIIGTDGLEGPGDLILEQAVIEGRTLFASTGDTGSSCPIVSVNTNGLATQAYPALNYPSASPFAVAVGGTDVNSNGGTPPQRLSETAWEYGGGGNSTNEPAGKYQYGVAPLNCVTDQQGNPFAPGLGPVCRGTPDVAALSGDVFTGNGMMITTDSGIDQFGAGTSLSSPLWLGMWTRVQAASRRQRHAGFANFSLYRAAQSAAYSYDFYDVIAGDNTFYPAKIGWDNATGWGAPDVAHLMFDLTGFTTPLRTTTVQPVPAFNSTSCGNLFTDPAGDDVYVVEGQTLGAQGTDPQLDILSARMLLSADGKTLRTIITLRNLTTTIPTGAVENDYNMVWTYNGIQYFSQLAVEQGGVVNAYDGQLIRASLENRYQQFHVDTAVFTPGPNGTVEVDVPLANVGNPPPGAVLIYPSAAAYAREGVLAGPLEPVDTAGPSLSFVVAGGCP